jgi:hypothetical protein
MERRTKEVHQNEPDEELFFFLGDLEQFIYCDLPTQKCHLFQNALEFLRVGSCLGIDGLG